jgi:ABC-type lipoprotein release transport system permease subunit
LIAVWLRFRAELRTRWRAWLGLGLLVGVAAGAVLGLITGARRTDSAYDRFLEAHHAHDVMVVNYPEDDTAVFDLDEIARLPQVANAARASYEFTGPGIGTPMLAGADDHLGRQVDRLKLLEGRLADPARANEVVVSFQVAEEHDLHVGSRFVVADLLLAAPGTDFYDTASPEEQQLVRAARAAIPGGKATVVGIVALPGGFPPQEGGVFCCVVGTPAFARLGLTEPNEALLVRLRHGADEVERFRRELERRAEPQGKSPQAYYLRDSSAETQRSIHTQAVALELLAVLVAFAAVVVLAQLLARLFFVDADDHTTLDALGMTRRQRWVLCLVRSGLIGAVGGLFAIPVAIAFSPVFPTGLARIAEPNVGLAADLLVLSVGAIATAILLIMVAAIPAWLTTRVRRGDLGTAQTKTTRSATVLSRAGAPPPVSVGVAMALERRRGRTSVPIVSSLAAITLGVAVVAGALTFGASLEHLTDTPRLYGAPWDFVVTTYFNPDEPPPADTARAIIDRHPAVAGFSVSSFVGQNTRIDGYDLGFVAVDAVRGTVLPPIVEGRAPRRDSNEIVFGTRTMEDLDVEIGDTVGLAVSPQRTVRFRVVGRGVLPASDDQVGLGRGAFVSHATLVRLAGVDEFDYGAFEFVVRLAPGADPDRVFAELSRTMCPDPGLLGEHCGVFRADIEEPVDVVNFGRASSTPFLLAAVLAVFAAGTLVHVLVTAIRRRRRDFAILKTLGFNRRQVRTAVAVQSSTTVAIAMIIGLPLGIVAGRWLWSLRADELGIVNEPSLPWLALGLVVLAALVLAVGIAGIAGRSAANTRPRIVLRSE